MQSVLSFGRGSVIRAALWSSFVVSLACVSPGNTQGWSPADAATSCDSEASSAFSAGYSQGQIAGFDSGFNTGYGHGADDGAAFCTANPLQCGVTVDQCVPPAGYGETEPNDNIIAADPLPFGQSFWGQSYGAIDQDWYYIVTTQANQNLTVSFSVPDGSTLAGWRVAIRDAAGNLFAQFDSSGNGNVASASEGIAYRVTLGFAGTYYIVVQPANDQQSFAPYSLAAILQDSPSNATNYVVGFADTEVEPNNLPGQSSWLTGGVTMYGIINLTFVPGALEYVDDQTRAYLQGESDWYAYISDGSEVVTLSFCDRQTCSAGNWFVELYDKAGANTVAAGGYATPLLAFNTDTSSTVPLVYRVGLGTPDTYYLRVNHKRLFTAPCAGYLVDINDNGQVDNNDQVDGSFLGCGCPGGQSCDLDVRLPAELGTVVVTGDGEQQSFEWFCPNGDGATVIAGTEENATALLCAATCECVTWGTTVEIPEGAITSQYNFTWQPTQLPPGTYATEAYQNYISRPSPY